MTLGGNEKLVSVVLGMLMDSWSIYEAYTSPLGVGWMVNPDHHYGPNVDGYEYSKWGRTTLRIAVALVSTGRRRQAQGMQRSTKA